MKVLSFFRLFGKRWSGRKARRSAGGPARRPQSLRPHLDQLEDRTLLATPAPQVLPPNLVSFGGNNSNPAIAIDPLDPQRAVAVWSRSAFPVPNNPQRVFLEGAYTTNGGLFWSSLFLPTNYIDSQTTNPSRPHNHAAEPSVGFDRNRNFYILHTQHNGAPPYTTTGLLVFHKYNFQGAFPSKVLLPGEGFGGQGKVIYGWAEQDPAIAATMVVDNTLPSFTDPDTGRVQTNPTAGNIYVAFSSNDQPPPNTPDPWPRNVIRIMASSDGGNSFGTSYFVNPNTFIPIPGFPPPAPSSSERPSQWATSPRLVVSQGTADGRVRGGQITVAWDEFSTASVANIRPNAPRDRTGAVEIMSLAGGVGLGFAGLQPGDFPIPIADALQGTPNVPQTTVIPVAVNITHPAFTNLREMEVTLAAQHNSVQDLQIVLVAPDGRRITLVRNGAPGGGMNVGINGSNLGFVNNQVVGTVFDDQAARGINLPGANAPYMHRYRPEYGAGVTFANFFENTPAQLNGIWQLEITDFVFQMRGANDPPRQLRQFEIHFTSGMEPLLPIEQRFPTLMLGDLLPPFPGIVRQNEEPRRPSVFPDLGYNSQPALASDNTLGSFSPYQGRIYLAYTDYVRVYNATLQDVNPIEQAGAPFTNTDVFLRYSDDGGLTWTLVAQQLNDDNGARDGFSCGQQIPGTERLFGQTNRLIVPICGRPQFMPELAVDQATGTLVATFLDTRDDAAGRRAATYMTYSVDGGTTFSPQVYVSGAREARDAITGRFIGIEPQTGNQSDGYPFREANYGYGQRMGLAVSNGRVYPVWSSNWNQVGPTDPPNVIQRLSIYTGRVLIPAGPRIIASTMGPVRSLTVDGFTFNNTFTTDGTRRADSFVIEFDRPVDPNTVSADLMTVTFRSPATPASTPGINLDVIGVIPLNPGLFGIPSRQIPGATRFLVRFDPIRALQQTGSLTGTYSYSVRPLVRDRIRLPATTVQATGQELTFVAPPNQVNLRIPPVGTGGDFINPLNNLLRSQITLSNLPLNLVASNVRVVLNLQHTFVGDLRITLVAPDGTRVILSDQNGGNGAGYTDTVFLDSAPTFISDPTSVPPFIGQFKPEQPLAGMIGRALNGLWTLEIEDLEAGDIGTLQNWTLVIQPGTVTATEAARGSRMDQNADGITGQEPSDIYSIPRPLSGIPFRPPYDQTTLPIIVPGPYIVSTRLPGVPATPDNLALNRTVSEIEVLFDRDMDPASFTPAQILRIMGPAGLISGPFTVTANPAGTDPVLARRTFRIGFPTQRLSGTYTLSLAAGIRAANGEPLDINQNAGLDVMRDTAAPGTTNRGVTFAANNVNIALDAQKTTTAVINVPENFVVQGVTLLLNITHPNVPDLTATLIAPDGAEVRLFTKVGNVAGSRANFTNTQFDDAATVPIQRASPPYFGTFNPQAPLSGLINRPAGGQWRLVIRNDSATAAGRLNSWSLTILRATPNSGLGEPVADLAAVSFRIFTMAVNNPLSQSVWTAVGPAPIGQGAGNRSSRIGGLAVDPSDPSGNTVYVAGASGGVWKTSNFLTTNPQGPTYIPLTDFGPTFGTNIGGLTVLSRNNDPRQSMLFVATGEGDTFTRGVGVLRSMDGGATWTVLDSSVNVDPQGRPLPISDARRDHIFAGSTTFKVVVDPRLSSTGDAIVYVAVSDITGQDRQNNRAGGIWRSIDSGRTWQRMRAGQATDIFLAPQTASEPTGQLQVLYAGFQGEGVFLSPNQGVVWNLMTGLVGKPLVRNAAANPPESITVTPPAATPNGAKGRITIAGADITGNRALDTVYAGWLYAVVSTTAGFLDGLYMTKDFGQNWTQVRIPGFRSFGQNAGVPGAPATYVLPTNDTTQADNNLLASGGEGGQGNYDVSLVVDPTNPNIVYVGGADGEGAARSPNRLIRVDTTRLADPHLFLAFSNLRPDGGLIQGSSVGSVTSTNNNIPLLREVPPLLISDFTPIVNLLRDPDSIFLNDATIRVRFAERFTNQGYGARWAPFVDVLEGSVDQHRAVAYRDPTTGRPRLIFGDDQGVFSGIDFGDGRLLRGVGGQPEPDGFNGDYQIATGTRNGNLQITQFYYGATQPSILAAEIAGSLFYGTNQDTGAPKSVPDILRTGNLVWRGIGGDGGGIATDQTGSGLSYQYMWGCCGGGGTNFFQVNLVGTPPENAGVGRTFGLLQQNLPGDTPDPQWPLLGVANLAVNPLSGNQAIIGSFGTENGVTAGGKLFRTQNQGLTWFQIADTADLDGTQPQAMAYGAPSPGAPGPQGNLDDFIYAGTFGGRIFVTFTGGGGAPGNRWRNISAGLDGSPIEDIVTNPLRGSREAFAVTRRGVYYMADSSAANAAWVNISGNILSITHDPFGDASLREPRLRVIYTLAADWRYTTNPNGPRIPVLYVGGEGGVFRSADRGRTWRVFPDAGDGAPAPGGYLPNTQVTDLDLALGNVNPTDGRPNESAGFDMLVASTYGRGVFAIRLPDLPGIQPFPGPRVVSVDAGSPVSPGFSTFTITFSGPVDPETFTPAAIRSFLGPNGPITVVSVQDLQDPITKQPPHNTYRITFPGQVSDGIYTLVLGPNLSDFAGNGMNQNSNDVNAEEPNDRFTVRFVINTSDNGRFITGVFNDLLRRRSDTEGFLQYIPVVDAARAQALGPVGRLFAGSPEARSRLIADYYQTSSPTVIGNFLRRPASPADIAAWVAFLQAGGTPAQVVNLFVSSLEYYQNAGGTDLGFITRLFSDLLARGLDTAGRDAFLKLLSQSIAGARADIVNTLNRSPEYYGGLVRGFYTKYLGRAASAADVTLWVGQLASGRSAESVIAALVGSGEYFQAKGGNNDAWANAAFSDILGRPADGGGRAFLLGQVAATGSREAAALSLLSGAEYRGNLVRGWYSKFLGRSASQGEVDAWVGVLVAGALNEQVITALVASAEYLARAGGTNQGFLSRAYFDLLGRGPDAAGRDAFLTNLARAQTGARQSVASIVTGSPEYFTRIITTTYQTYLRRNAGQADINIWLPLLSTKADGTPGSVSPQEQFFGNVISSGEYFALNGNTNRSWVASLYTNVLRRGGSPTEIELVTNVVLDFFAGQRSSVAETIFTSDEARRTFIISSYSTLLRRSPLDQDVASWLNLFKNGLREEQFIGAIVGSPEYFQRQANNNLTQFLDQVYQDLLGRARGVGEAGLLNPLLAGQFSRQQVTDLILGSLEYRRRIISGFYRTYLNREPNISELDTFVTALVQGTRQSKIAASLLASREYYLASHPYP